MKSNSSTVASAGIIAVLILSLWAVLDFYQTIRTVVRTGADPYHIEAQVERLQPVLAMLPPGAVVGYISDVPLDETTGTALFFGSQYALAPHLLVAHKSPQKREWVLGNFARPPDLTQIEQAEHVRVVKDLGSGIVLFRSEGH